MGFNSVDSGLAKLLFGRRAPTRIPRLSSTITAKTSKPAQKSQKVSTPAVAGKIAKSKYGAVYVFRDPVTSQLCVHQTLTGATQRGIDYIKKNMVDLGDGRAAGRIELLIEQRKFQDAVNEWNKHVQEERMISFERCIVRP